MKKVISIVLILMMAVFFVGCGKDVESGEEVCFKKIIPEVTAEYFSFYDGMGLFNSNNKYGYIDINGKVLIKPKYIKATCFSGGYAFVENEDEKVCIIDKEGAETSLEKFDVASNFSGGGSTCKFVEDVAIIELAKAEGEFVAINTKGEEIFRIDNARKYYGRVKNSYIFYGESSDRDEIECVVVDLLGEELAKFRVPMIAGAFMSDELKFSDEDGLVIKAEKNGEYGVVDFLGEVVIHAAFEDLQFPSEGMIACKKDGKWGFIDYDGTVVIEPTYDNAFWFSNGLCGVVQNKQLGFIDKNNTFVIKPSISMGDVDVYSYYRGDYLKFNKEGIAKISQTPGQIIDKTGRTVLSTNGAILGNLAENIFTILDTTADDAGLYILDAKQ